MSKSKATVMFWCGIILMALGIIIEAETHQIHDKLPPATFYTEVVALFAGLTLSLVGMLKIKQGE